MTKSSQEEKQADDQKYPPGLIALSLIVPAFSLLLASGLFLIFRRLVPAGWAVHVDGYGNITYGSWWSLFFWVFLLTFVAFLLGQYLARDFSRLEHWYPQQKGVVILCFSLGYGLLGFLMFNMVSAWAIVGPSTVENLMGYGLLGFVMVAILAGILYTKFLPKAKQIHRTQSDYS